MSVEQDPRSRLEHLQEAEGHQPGGAIAGDGRTSNWRRMARHPLIRIVVASLAILLVVALTQSALRTLRGHVPLPLYYGLFATGSVLVMLVTYRAFVRLVERRAPREVAAAGAAGELVRGLLLGASLAAAIVGLLWLAGAYVVMGVTMSMAVAGALATDVAGGLLEELLFRAVLFRIGRELVGTWWALLLSSLLFGLVHAGTPITVAVAALGGLLCGAAYMLTGRVWMAAGIHIAWDFVQDGVLGVSGGQTSVLQARLTGPVALTGGAVGIEGSLLTLVLVGVVAGTGLAFALRHGQIPPRASGLAQSISTGA